MSLSSHWFILLSVHRLYGGYEALKGGKTAEAMTDFTGGVVESFALKDNHPGLFERMIKSSKRASLMSCSVAVNY